MLIPSLVLVPALALTPLAAPATDLALRRVYNSDDSYNRVTQRPMGLLVSDYSNPDRDTRKELVPAGDRMRVKTSMRSFYVPYHCQGLYKRPLKKTETYSDGWHSNPHPSSRIVTITLTDCKP